MKNFDLNLLVNFIYKLMVISKSAPSKKLNLKFYALESQKFHIIL